MGRPLKIQKYGTAQGITYNADGTANTPAAAVPVDQGDPNCGSLTDPVYNSADTLNSTQFYGVVGGAKSSALSTTFPIVKCEVNITNSASGQTAGQIIRQKGSRKFMVATTTAIDPENAVVGVALRIAVVGDTDWSSMGAPAGYGVGTIFTPTAASAAGTTGTAQEVGTCVLTSDLTPTAGNMSISYFSNDSVETAISKLTNKFLQNFAGGETGGSANTGDVWNPAQVVNNVEFAANFFSDEGTTAKSGAEVDTWGTNGSDQLATGALDLGIVENYTS
jgi:hypothetical protein